MKKSISVILALCLTVSFFPLNLFNLTANATPSTVPQRYTYKDFYYSFVDEYNRIMITGYKNKDIRNLSIPNSINGHSVTVIGNNAFQGCTEIESIYISYNVKEIRYAAFKDMGSRKLKEISVADNNFYYQRKGNCLIETKTKTLLLGCKNSIIPNDGSVTSIDMYAFNYCTDLTDITIPDKIKSIDRTAFDGCKNFKLIYADGFGSINSNKVIPNCPLAEIVIPASVISIDSSAFNYCDTEKITVDENNSVYNNNGNCLIETQTKKLIFGCKDSVIPTDGSVTSIGDYAFYRCNGLKSITIPEVVTEIGKYAFSYCSNLETMTLPFIGQNCSSQTYLGSVFGASSYEKNSKYVPASLKNITVTGITNIPENAFYNCSNIKSIKISDSVTTIGEKAFYNCKKLDSIILPNNITSIPSNAFINTGYYSNPDNWINDVLYIDNYLIAAKTSISDSCIIKDGTKTIASSAFLDCSSLKNILIPDSVQTIGSSAFNGCTSLSGIIVDKNNTVFHSNGNCLIDTKAKKLILGCNNSVIPSGGNVKIIGKQSFEGCAELKSITIPEGIEKIEYEAFKNCSKLENVIIPNSVIRMGYATFNGCNSLKNISLPFVGTSRYATETNAVLGEIFGCLISARGYVENATLQYTYDKLGHTDYWYYIPSSLKSVTITGTTIIPEHAFYNCSKIESIRISNSVTTIGDEAFYNCDKISNITIPGTVKYIGENAFVGCKNIVCQKNSYTEKYVLKNNLQYSLLGDSNDDKDLNGSDIIALCQYLAYYDYDTETSIIDLGIGADANNDGVVNGSDIIILCQYFANYDYDTETSTIPLG